MKALIRSMSLIMVVSFVLSSNGCFPPWQINENKQWARKIGGGVPRVVEWTIQQENHIAYGQGMGALAHLAYKRSSTEEEIYEAFKAIKDKRESGWRIRAATTEEVPYLRGSYDPESYNVDGYFWGRFYDTWARSCLAFENSQQTYERLRPSSGLESTANDRFEFFKSYWFDER